MNANAQIKIIDNLMNIHTALSNIKRNVVFVEFLS